jgi:putative chitinase
VITPEQLRRIMPYGAGRISTFHAALAGAMAEFEINTTARQAAFLAQLAHESGEFRYVRELASGDDYEGREDLGNTEPGDGPRFRGRGLIQITGRKNYRLVSAALFSDPDYLLRDPTTLEQPGPACRSAGWFWVKGAGLNLSKRALAHGVLEGCDLNELADAGDFTGITLAVNGGMNGFADRKQYYARAQAALQAG